MIWLGRLSCQFNILQKLYHWCGDALRSRSWRLNSQKTIKQVFFITAPGTRGISPPNVCAKRTHLLVIYATLTYTFTTFPRNAYHSFTENSLVYGNVLHACLLVCLLVTGGVFRLSWSLVISVVCIPVLSRPYLTTIPVIHKEPRLVSVVQWFWPLHLLHSQVSVVSLEN